jgi:hypothetical protein
MNNDESVDVPMTTAKKTGILILTGLLGGLLLVLGNIFLKALSEPFASILSLGRLWTIQWIGFFLFTLLLVGAVSARLSNRIDQVHYNWIGSGIFSGALAGIVFFFGNLYVLSVQAFNRNHYFSYAEDPFLLKLFLHNLGYGGFIALFLLLITLLVSVLFGGLGAYLEFLWERKKTSGLGRAASKKVRGKSVPFAVFVSLILILIILPPGIAYVGTQSGFIYQSPYCCGIISDNVIVHRVNNSSIEIIQETQHTDIPENSANTFYPHDWTPRWKIFMNGKEMTNMSVIQQEGLGDTIYPPEGLQYGIGHRILLSGPELTGNETNPCHIEIIELFPTEQGYASFGDKRDIW